MALIENGMLSITVYSDSYLNPELKGGYVDHFEIYTDDINKFNAVFEICTKCLVMPICIDIDQDEDGYKIDIRGPCQECKDIINNS